MFMNIYGQQLAGIWWLDAYIIVYVPRTLSMIMAGIEDWISLVNIDGNEIAPENHKQPSKWKACCSCLSPLIQIILLVTILVTLVIIAFVIPFSSNCPACNVTCGVGNARTDDQTAIDPLLSDYIQEMRATSKNLSDFTAVLRNLTQSLEQVPGNSKAILTNLSASLQQVLETTTAAMHKNISDSVQQVLETTGNSTTMLTHLSSFMQQVVDTTGDTGQTVSNIVDTLANHDSTSVSTAGTINDLLLITQKLLQLQNVSSLLNSILPLSCKDIKAILPNSPTGYYHVNSHTIYCNMDTLCNGTGGWTRLAYLNMSDATQNCPSGFRLYQSGEVRACGRPVSNSGSCVSVQFPSNGISYSQVCGRVVGYQYNSPDAVNDYYGSNHNNLNGDYVDGVSITRGSPRQHVWTLMADNGAPNCPCANNNLPQSFIGNHYYCEAASTSCCGDTSLYTSDPLWDGQGCYSSETACCSAPGLPWFHRDYGNTTTTDYLELRVCCDTGNEDVPVGYYEIYVK